MHTVVAASPDGTPIRVACGYCGSEHNYRGGPRIDTGGASRQPPASSAPRTERAIKHPLPIVSERERTGTGMSTQDADLEMLLRRVIREEAGVTPVVPAEKWRNGTLVLRPGNATQEKSWPIEAFFHKVVMIRNRLRTLEQVSKRLAHRFERGLDLSVPARLLPLVPRPSGERGVRVR